MRIIYFYLITSLIIVTTGCKERFSPKPKGYLRIDLKQKKDTLFNPINCPFYFNSSDYFQLKIKNNCWIDLEYEEHNATIHITYKNIEHNLIDLLEESRNMVYKHTIKADAINEKTYLNNIKNTYGTLYDIQGPVASSVQFHITDSIKHFIRGALYFKTAPNQDSLKPIINYVRRDIIRIMETLTWGDVIASSK